MEGRIDLEISLFQVEKYLELKDTTISFTHWNKGKMSWNLLALSLRILLCSIFFDVAKSVISVALK